MKFELDSLSLKDLKSLQSEVAEMIATFEVRKKQEALSALEEQAKAFGYSLSDLMGAAASKKRKPAKAKYANPENRAETWTGRGRKPRWMEAALKAGRKPEDMLA